MLIFSKKSPCRGANMAILGAHWQAQAGDAVARGRLRSWLTQVFFKAHAIYPRAHVAAPPEAAHAPPQVDGHLLEEVGRLVGILREHAAHGVYRGAGLGDEPLKFFLASFWSRIFAIVLFSNAALFLRRAPGPFCYTSGAVFFRSPFRGSRARSPTHRHAPCVRPWLHRGLQNVPDGLAKRPPPPDETARFALQWRIFWRKRHGGTTAIRLRRHPAPPLFLASPVHILAPGGHNVGYLHYLCIR